MRRLLRFLRILRVGRRICLQICNSEGLTHPSTQVREDHPILVEVPSSCYTGVLFLLYSCVLMIFWRVFMRISYSCPEHLKFSLTIESWTNLVELTGDAVDWLDRNDKIYDVWMLVAYAA